MDSSVQNVFASLPDDLVQKIVTSLDPKTNYESARSLRAASRATRGPLDPVFMQDLWARSAVSGALEGLKEGGFRTFLFGGSGINLGTMQDAAKSALGLAGTRDLAARIQTFADDMGALTTLGPTGFANRSLLEMRQTLANMEAAMFGGAPKGSAMDLVHDRVMSDFFTRLIVTSNPRPFDGRQAITAIDRATSGAPDRPRSAIALPRVR